MWPAITPHLLTDEVLGIVPFLLYIWHTVYTESWQSACWTIVNGEPVNFLVIWYNLIPMHADLYNFHCSAERYDANWLAHDWWKCNGKNQYGALSNVTFIFL